MSLTLRLATPDDLPLIYDITQQSFAEYHGLLDPPSGAERETRQDVERALREGSAVFAYLEREAAGCVRYVSEEGGIYVGRLAVLPTRRRHGIGTALLDFVEAQARVAGAARLRLRVRLALPENIRLYTRLGYRVTGLHPRSATDVACTMVKDLAPASLAPVADVVAPLLPDLQRLEPSARGVLLLGSYAHGTPGPFSDLDLCIVTGQPPVEAERLRLLQRPEGILPVSIRARRLEDIAREAADPDAWPELRDIYARARVLSGPDTLVPEIRNRIDDLSPDAAALWRTAEHDILSLLEALGKAKNAAARLDPAALLAGTGRAAACAARLLRPLNPPWQALHPARLAAAFATWSVAPPGAEQDAMLCLGQADAASLLSPPLLAALRLGTGTLELLAPHAGRLPLGQDLSDMLVDGRLMLLARQEFGHGGLSHAATA